MELKHVVANNSIKEDYSWEARRKWLEYHAAVKGTHVPGMYKDLAKIYYQLYKGKTVIDVHQAISNGGLLANGMPKLAIAKADTKIVQAEYHRDGTVKYYNEDRGWKNKDRFPMVDVILRKCLPEVKTINWNQCYTLKAPVPMMPPQIAAKLEKVDRSDYYILWEVDKWEIIAPGDPWLLRRITEKQFVVLVGWNLTAAEKMVMNAHL